MGTENLCGRERGRRESSRSPQQWRSSIRCFEEVAKFSFDDVRCTHGATVGKLEQEPLFYLKSRGIPQAEAEKIVVEGFFDPIFQRIPFEGVRERFQEYIANKMA